MSEKTTPTWTDPDTGQTYIGRTDGSRPPEQIEFLVLEAKREGAVLSRESFRTEFEWETAQQVVQQLGRR